MLKLFRNIHIYIIEFGGIYHLILPVSQKCVTFARVLYAPVGQHESHF